MTALFTSKKELLRQNQYLKVEVEILRSRVQGRLEFTPAERRRLVRAGQYLGKMLKHLVTIVHPETLRRWIRAEKKGAKAPVKKRGRRRTAEEIRQLVIKFATENTWGYPRILGEVKKLGVKSLSKSTVKRILKEAGIEPCPQRRDSVDLWWKRNLALWQCDFLSKKVWSLTGVRDAYVLVFIHVKTRQVIVSPATFHPNEAWVLQETNQFLTTANSRGLRVGLLQHDRDKKFTKSFRTMLKQRAVTPVHNRVMAPTMNAFIERFIQSIQTECLNNFSPLRLKQERTTCWND